MAIIAAPIKQINHKYINRSIDQWLDIHYGDTSFNGRVVIGHRKNKGGIYTMSVRPLSDLRPYVKLVHASTRLDYYITANTIKGVDRRKEDLFGLQNIVIDVDCHDDSNLRNVASLVEAFIWRSKRDLWDTGVIPTPNSIVRTGRGIQLWWALVPCYGGSDYGVSLHYHEKIKETLMDHIEAMLDEYGEELGDLGVDRGASSNPVGYFRLPFTYNTKAKCYSSLEILHSERYDQRDLALLERPEGESVVRVQRRVARHIPLKDSDRSILRNFQSTGVRRVIQMIKLRNLRDNEVGSEMRDYFNFSVYNALRMSYDHHSAMARLRAFNDGFKKPMTNRELDNCVSSAEEKEGYKYTNTKLIELLEITPDEQQAIGLFPYARKRRSKPNASRDAAREALREDRDAKILELVSKGVSQAETARILGIGKNTVYRVLQRQKTAQVEPAEVIIYPIIERHQNGSIYVLNNSASAKSVLPGRGLVGQVGGRLFVMPEEDTS